MYLELAENRVQVSGYTRNPRVKKHTRRYPTLNEETNPYIFVPDFERGGGLFIREDKFDSMPEHQFKMFVRAIASVQPEVQSGQLSEAIFLASRAERREQRARRKEAKTQKKEGKGQARKERQERKKLKQESKAEARKTRAEAKKTKAEGGKGGFDWEKAKDVGGSLISKFTGKGGEEAGSDGQGGAPTEATPFYKNPAVIIGGVALLAGIGYLATRKK